MEDKLAQLEADYNAAVAKQDCRASSGLTKLIASPDLATVPCFKHGSCYGLGHGTRDHNDFRG